MLKQLVTLLIKAYGYILSPLLGSCCRFEPSCSQYTLAAIEKLGLFRGLYKSGKRIMRCHPWGPGGYDPLDVD